VANKNQPIVEMVAFWPNLDQLVLGREASRPHSAGNFVEKKFQWCNSRWNGFVNEIAL
jgi:hypothetical protein